MKYSAVVISKGRHALLERSVKALREAAPDLQIVVVEAIDEATSLNVKNVKYIRIPAEEAAFSKQRNIGVENAEGDYIVFVDDDCEITPGWFEILKRTIDRGDDTFGVMGAVYPKDPGVVGFCEGVLGHPAGGFKLHSKAQGSVIPLTQVSTCNTIIKKSVIRDVEGFNIDNKFGSEDSDISIRITEKFGKEKFRYDPDALAYHKPRNSIGKIIPWYIRRGKSDAELFLEYPVQRKYSAMTSVSLKVLLIFILAAVFRSIYILLAAFIFWYFLQLYRHRFMVNYFKFYNFSRAKRAFTFVVFPFVKLVADLMYDLGRMIRVFKPNER
jgi:glycosyltransferase involved in cell wall biosynthesis